MPYDTLYRPGSRVDWTPAESGGWGWLGNPVAGVVEKVHKRRIRIRVAIRRRGVWRQEHVAVLPETLRHREIFVAEVDELATLRQAQGRPTDG